MFAENKFYVLLPFQVLFSFQEDISCSFTFYSSFKLLNSVTQQNEFLILSLE